MQPPRGPYKVPSLGGEKKVIFEEEKVDRSVSGQTEEAEDRGARAVGWLPVTFSCATSSTQDRRDKGVDEASTKEVQQSLDYKPKKVGGSLFRMSQYQREPAQAVDDEESRNAQRNDLQSLFGGAGSLLLVDDLDQDLLTGDLPLGFENELADPSGPGSLQRPLEQQPTSNSQSTSKQNVSSESGTAADKKMISDNQPQDVRGRMSPKSILNSCQSNHNGHALGDSKNSNQSAGQQVVMAKPMGLQKNNSGQPPVRTLSGQEESHESDQNQVPFASRLVKNTSIKSDEQKIIKKKSPSQNDQDSKVANQLCSRSQVVRNHSFTKSYGQGNEDKRGDDKRSQGTTDKVESLHADYDQQFLAQQRKKNTLSDTKHGFQEFGEAPIRDDAEYAYRDTLSHPPVGLVEKNRLSAK